MRSICCNNIETDWNRFGLLVVLILFSFSEILYGYFGKPLVRQRNFLLFLVLKLWSRPMHASRHSILWNRKLSQRSKQHDSKTIQDSMHREIWFIVYSCLFLVLLYFINRHAESCQFVAFLNSYFYRRILLTCRDLPICGIRNQSIYIFFSFQGWLIF